MPSHPISTLHPLKVLALAALSSLVAMSSLAHEPLLLWGDDDNYPSCYIDDQGKLAGTDIEVLKELSARTGITFNIKLRPWKRVLTMIQSGAIDGGFPLAKTPERELYALYTATPLRSSSHGIYTTTAGQFDYRSIADFRGKIIGVQRAFFISEQFSDALKAGIFKTYEADKVEQLIKMTQSGRIDAFLSKPRYVDKVTRSTRIQTAHIGDIPIPDGAYLVLSKRSKRAEKEELLRQINQALSAMSKDGTMARLSSQNKTRTPPPEL